ncbi:MAG: TRAP transporter large permease subunit, partial [Spirochaetota bacterium]
DQGVVFIAKTRSIGILFPPSLPIILIGVSTGTSVAKMFAGGMIPGILLLVAMSAFGVVSALRHHVPVEPFSLRETGKQLHSAIWEILLPILLIAGYFSGLLSIVETASFSVLYTFVIEVFVNRDIKLRDVGKVFLKALPIIGGILAILASSQALSYYIVDAEIPQLLTRWVQSFIASPILFILLLNLVLIVAGAFMEIYASIIVLLPLIGPLGAAYGLSPVHLGIIFLVNMEVAFICPPVGLNILLASYRLKAPFFVVTKSVLPFLLIQIVVVLVVSYFPALTTALAGLF